jgi:hypothetical protein
MHGFDSDPHPSRLKMHLGRVAFSTGLNSPGLPVPPPAREKAKQNRQKSLQLA